MSRLDSWIEAWSDTDRIAFHFEGHDIPYAQLHRRVGIVAAGLVQAGVGLGDRVAFCGLNRVELFEALFSCARIGAILVPLNNRLSEGEIAVQLADSRPRLVLVTDGFGALVESAGAHCPVRDLDVDPFTAGEGTPARADETGSEVSASSSASADGPPGRPPSGPRSGAEDAPELPLLMVYTSGTTGTPKGALLTQRALHYTVLNGIDQQGLDGDDVIIAPLPTFHVGGLNIQTLPTLEVGGRVILLRRFDPGAVLDLIATHRPTQTLLVPAMLQAISQHPRFAATDLSCLDGIVTGSSVVPWEIMAPYFDRGVPVAQVYGASETGPTSLVVRYDEALGHATSAGRPARHTELRIVDSDGTELGEGETGELWLRGPNLFSGYWENPEATGAAFTGDWYRTGDVGYRDVDGFVYICDRIKDVYISGGENVYPAEVEAVLANHPAIAEVAVVARADQQWGEVGVAAVVVAEGAELDLGGLRSWCKGHLARFKQPAELLVVDHLPRTALGKVQKHVLRSEHGLTGTS